MPLLTLQSNSWNSSAKLGRGSRTRWMGQSCENIGTFHSSVILIVTALDSDSLLLVLGMPREGNGWMQGMLS